MGDTKYARPCEARVPKRRSKICAAVARTMRIIQAAPGLWIHVALCNEHQAVWDQATNWKERRIVREPYFPDSEFCKLCDGFGGKKWPCRECGEEREDD